MLKLINYTLFIILTIFMISACAMYTAYDDMMDNKYLNTAPFPNPDSSYMGTWTTNMAGGLVCIKINPDGTGRYCQNKMSGIIEKIYAKIYKESNGDLYLINEVGVRYKILDYSTSYINTISYGHKYKFIPGVQSLNCKDFIPVDKK